ncbi:MAG: 30S ribosomal protein S6 [Desulfomonilaceae bacterium]
MRRYEALIILDPDMADDDVKALNERFGAIIRDHSGEIIKIEDWGARKLAYLVNKKDKGRYILFDFVSGPELIIELERQFKITEDVLKYLSVKLDEEVDLEAFKAKAEKEAVEAEAKKVEELERAVLEEPETAVSVETPAAATEVAAEASSESAIPASEDSSSTKEGGE